MLPRERSTTTPDQTDRAGLQGSGPRDGMSYRALDYLVSSSVLNTLCSGAGFLVSNRVIRVLSPWRYRSTLLTSCLARRIAARRKLIRRADEPANSRNSKASISRISKWCDQNELVTAQSWVSVWAARRL